MIPLQRACAALGLPRATLYRHIKPKAAKPPTRRGCNGRRLSDAERQVVMQVLHEPRFVDQPPAQVYAKLLDEGRYLCSVRTMHRLLCTACESGERRGIEELIATRQAGLDAAYADGRSLKHTQGSIESSAGRSKAAACTDVRQGRGMGDYDGTPAAHCFKRRQTEALVERWIYKARSNPIQRSQLAVRNVSDMLSVVP